MLYRVEIAAENVQTETHSEDQAYRNVRDDAAEFYGDWNYVFRGAAVVPAGDPSSPTVDPEGMEIDVELTGSADGLFTFDAVHAVLVEAPDEETAKARALVLPKEIRYGTAVPPKA